MLEQAKQRKLKAGQARMDPATSDQCAHVLAWVQVGIGVAWCGVAFGWCGVHRARSSAR